MSADENQTLNAKPLVRPLHRKYAATASAGLKGKDHDILQ